MSNTNNQANQVGIHHVCPVVPKHELIDHLNNFHRDVNRYIHSLPAIVLGIPSSNLISTAVTLNWNIECFRNAVAETMLREGLVSDRLESTLPNAPPGFAPSPNTMRRIYDHSQRAPFGGVPHLAPVAPSIAQGYAPHTARSPALRPPRSTSQTNRGRGRARMSQLIDHNTTFTGTISQQFKKENSTIVQQISHSSAHNIPGLFDQQFTN